MKKYLPFLIVMCFLLTLTPVLADSPQPFQYALVKCSSLTLAQIQSANQDFDSSYGWQHNLVTDWQWKTSYESRVNEFANSLGCPSVLQDGTLTLWYRIYVPTYSRILRNVPQ